VLNDDKSNLVKLQQLEKRPFISETLIVLNDDKSNLLKLVLKNEFKINKYNI
jgi:hypothetical protein